jgi:hypothetical protein
MLNANEFKELSTSPSTHRTWALTNAKLLSLKLERSSSHALTKQCHNCRVSIQKMQASTVVLITAKSDACCQKSGPTPVDLQSPHHSVVTVILAKGIGTYMPFRIFFSVVVDLHGSLFSFKRVDFVDVVELRCGQTHLRRASCAD